MKRFFWITLSLCFSFFNVVAQQDNVVEMADIMRSNGKIYVVVAVLSIILAGVFVYLFTIDTKIRKIEKEIQK